MGSEPDSCSIFQRDRHSGTCYLQATWFSQGTDPLPGHQLLTQERSTLRQIGSCGTSRHWFDELSLLWKDKPCFRFYCSHFLSTRVNVTPIHLRSSLCLLQEYVIHLEYFKKVLGLPGRIDYNPGNAVRKKKKVWPALLLTASLGRELQKQLDISRVEKSQKSREECSWEPKLPRGELCSFLCVPRT